MKIMVYREAYSTPGLHLMEYLWVNLPWSEVMDRHYQSLKRLNPAGLFWSSSFTKKSSRRLLGKGSQTISFVHPEKGPTQVNGIILYSSMTELITFLKNSLVPDSPDPLSQLLRRAQDASGQVSTSLLERAILDDQDPHYDSTLPLPLDRIRGLRENSLTLVQSEAGPVWAWCSPPPEWEDLTFTLPACRSFGSYQVPYLKIVKPAGMRAIYADAPPGLNWASFDGERYQWFDSLEEFPVDLVQEMDENGYMFSQCDCDLLPMNYLECRALIRVPPQADCKELYAESSRGILEQRCADAALRAPGILYDSRSPVPVPAQTPLIDDPQTALWVLARSTRAVFVPTQEGRLFPLRNIPDKESFLILTRPQRIN